MSQRSLIAPPLATALGLSVLLAGLCAATSAHAQAPAACAPYRGVPVAELNHYEGLMHEHSSYSDGDALSIPADYYRRAKQAGYGFVGGSEHSDSYDAGVFIGVHGDCFTTPDGLLTCNNPSDERLQKWTSTSSQATVASNADFLAIRGFEWTSDIYGHINVYFSRNFSNAKTDGGFFATMDTFWDWFTRHPDVPGSGGSPTAPVPMGGGADGLAHFNHPHEKCQTEDIPGQAGACDWNDYTLIPAAVERMFGIETYNPGNGGDRYVQWIARALDKGWRLSFVGSEDEHDGNYASDSTAKTVVMSTSLAEQDFKAALLARRSYSLSPGKHYRVAFDAAGHPMGAQLSCTVGATLPLNVRVTNRDGSPVAGDLRLISNGGAEIGRINASNGRFNVPVKAGRNWYYVRHHGPDGQSTAYIAPVWVNGGVPVGEWQRGDMHVHSDHSSDGSALRQGADGRGPGNVSVADQIGQGVQNGLSWMPITDHRTYTQHYDPLWESDRLLLIPGEEANGSPHSTVLGAVDWIVQGAARSGAAAFERLQTSIWDAHAQGAVWSIAHPDDGMANADDSGNAQASAVGFDMVEGWNRASGVEREVNYAEGRWNKGFRFGMSGASDSHFRELWSIAGPGMPATGIFAGSYSERGILQGLNAGRSRITLDPEAAAPTATLEADFNNDGLYESLCGDEVVAPTGTSGKLRIKVANAVGTTVLLYKAPGRSAGAFRSYSPTAADFEVVETVAVDANPTWYRVEVRGTGQNSGVDTATLGAIRDGQIPTSTVSADQLRAVCSPIFVSNAPVAPSPELAAPADIGGDDRALKLLGSQGAFSGFPDVATSEGFSHVVAEVHGNEGTTQVQYRRVAADGTMSTAVTLSPASTAARFPTIAARGQNVWVAWSDERAGQVPRRSHIYLRQSSDGGNTWQPEQRLRQVAGRAERPDIALTPDGKPVVVWQEITAANPFDIYAQILGSDAEPINISRAGKTISAGNASDSRSPRYPASVWPSVAVAADGRIAVAYHDNRTDPDPLWTGAVGTGDSTDVENYQVRVHTRAASAGVWSSGVEIGSNSRAERHASLAFASNGDLLLAWDAVPLNAAGSSLVVEYARSSDGGLSFSAPAAIAADSVGMGQYPKLGVDAAGAVRAVWYDNRSSDWRWRVMTAVHDALGNWMQVETLPARGINTWPATSGGAIVFASTRNAERVQRDLTQEIFLRLPPVAPLPFEIIRREDVKLSTFITSELLYPKGFSGPLTVSISGGSGAQISVNGSPFTNEPLTILPGQTLAVRHISAATEATATTSTVSIGSYSTPFISVTTVFDRVPAPFDFGRIEGQAPGVLVASADRILSAYNAPAHVRAGPNAEFSLDGGRTWATQGTLAVGGTIRIRQRSNRTSLGYSKHYIDVGGVRGHFVVRTRQ